MASLHRDDNFDSTISFLLHPYEYISEKSKQLGSDIFITRFLLRKTICMTGKKAAELFYDETKFTRKKAMPGRIKRTLLGKGGVQGLDDKEHKHRKKMFVDLLMDEQKIEQLSKINEKWWEIYARRWQESQQIIFYDQLCEILTASICEWSGIELMEEEISSRSKKLKAMFDGAGAIGPRHWKAILARKDCERWIARIVKSIRDNKLHPASDSAAYVISNFRDFDGKLLKSKIAAVELLNVLRPTVAISVFILQTAHALYKNPKWREKIKNGNGKLLEIFTQEVRRFYPFFPAVAARVREDFNWEDFNFKKGTRAMLDIYGTNHDIRIWREPELFYPERFINFTADQFSFIPQGGGSYNQHHRCPGEFIAIQLINTALNFLVKKISYEVKGENLDINLTRVPALPHSPLIISNVKFS
ncbi:MAG: cypC [Rickettsiaceae bacterium]|jgi:fatty-acid peroxygenase|nr:cypC [Rickettsiaceae bacterium]